MPFFLLPLWEKVARSAGWGVLSANSNERLENGPVADHLERRRTVGAAREGDGAARGPGAAFQNAGERQRIRGAAEFGTNQFGEPVEQRHGQRAPLDDEQGIHRMRTLGVDGVTQ